MSHPPDGQKEREQQAVQMGSHLELGGFNVPTAGLGILKARLHAHAQGIRANAHLPSRQIGNEEPGLFKGFLPRGAHIGFESLFLPDARTAIPLLAFLVDEALEGRPVTPLFLLAHLSTAGLLLADAQHIMPLALHTQANQRCSRQSSVGQQGTLGLRHEPTHRIEQAGDDVPLPFLPTLLPWHHRPGDW